MKPSQIFRFCLILFACALGQTILAMAQPYELSYLVMRTRDHKVLFEQESEKLRTPASTTKLVTTLAILESGALDHRFSTQLLAETEPTDGKIQNLYLLGEADPELSLESLDALANEVKKAGVKMVLGDLVVDPGPYSVPAYGQGWAWDDAGSPYSPEISGLVIDHGGYPLDPRAPWLDARPDQVPAGVWMVPGQQGLHVNGALPDLVAPPNPPVRTAELLVQSLEKAGIKVRGGVREDRALGRPLATLRSRTLQEILKQALAESDNLAFELLYRYSGKKLPRVLESQQLRVVDGCGLSRYNLLSADQLVKVLLADRRFVELLPRAGEGTLRGRFQKGWAARQVAAKTGTLSNVSALAGYLFPDTQNECVFAILINGHTGPSSERKTLENELLDQWAKKIAWPFLD